jgi:DNA repair protein SbcC/Rad50
MDRIESISLRNYRLHKRLDLDLAAPIISIIGESYRGKSTVIRALKWVLTNKPAGLSMVRWGSKKTAVETKLDSHSIKRIRGKAVNLYKLDGHKLEAFGTDVPRPVAQIANVSPINFQGQHDAPFWFSETAGGVSKQLNAIVDLDIIDHTLATLAKQVSSAKMAVVLSMDRLKEAQEAKEGLSFVKEMTKEFDVLCDMDYDLQRKIRKADKLETIKGQIDRLRRDQERLRGFVEEGAKELAAIQAIRSSHKELSSRLERLVLNQIRRKRLLQTRAEALEDMMILESRLKEYKRCPLCGSKMIR